MKLTLSELEQANSERAEEMQMSIATFGNLYFAVELAGEVGELCNVIKKLERIKLLSAGHPMNYNARSEKLNELLREELGGVVIVADLLAQSLGLSLSECVQGTFNDKSEIIGSTIKL